MVAGLVLLLLPALAGAQELYTYTDSGGVVVFTDRHATNGKKVHVSSYNREKRESFKPPYDTIIRTSSERHGVDYSLINAVIKVESNFNEQAVSHRGAMGLMQLMPATARQLGVYHPYDPRENVDGGVRYLRHLIDRFDGNLKLALAAYNAGPAAVERYGTVPPITETRNYVRKVFSLYKGRRRVQTSMTEKPAYTLVLEDGSILYTNDKSYVRQAVRSW
jgi:soluble lytic murein transglycosylase